MAYQGRYNNGGDTGGSNQRRKKGSGTAWKIVLAVVLTFVLTLGLIAGVALWYISSKVGRVNQATFEEKDTSGQDLSSLIGNLDETAPPQLDSTVPTDPIETEPPTEAPTEAPTEPDYGKTGKVVNILVIGQDTREGEEHKLADCIMLLTLNKETHTVVMTSFLRDSYIKLPEYYRGHTCGWNRINTAYALGYSWYGTAGAMEMLDITLNNNYGVTVDGNVEFSFDAFKSVITAIGGVEVDLYGDELTYMADWAQQYNDHYDYHNMGKHVDIHEGTCLLNDDLALEYARARHVNAADSDMNRVKRQQIVLSQVVNKLTKMSPLELDNLINQILEQIVTDISEEDIKTYITELTPYLFNLNFVTNQIPADGTYKGEMKDLPDGPSGVLVNYNFQKNKEIMAAVQAGELPPTE